MLVLTLRAEEAATGEVLLGVSCGPLCGAELPLTATLAELPVEQWTTVGLPLKCFAQGGADLSRLDRVLQLRSTGALELSLSKVALGALNEAEHSVACAP